MSSGPMCLVVLMYVSATEDLRAATLQLLGTERASVASLYERVSSDRVRRQLEQGRHVTS